MELKVNQYVRGALICFASIVLDGIESNVGLQRGLEVVEASIVLDGIESILATSVQLGVVCFNRT